VMLRDSVCAALLDSVSPVQPPPTGQIRMSDHSITTLNTMRMGTRRAAGIWSHVGIQFDQRPERFRGSLPVLPLPLLLVLVPVLLLLLLVPPSGGSLALRQTPCMEGSCMGTAGLPPKRHRAGRGQALGSSGALLLLLLATGTWTCLLDRKTLAPRPTLKGASRGPCKRDLNTPRCTCGASESGASARLCAAAGALLHAHSGILDQIARCLLWRECVEL
jgi:hypothetical protein